MSWLQSEQTIFSAPKKISFFLSISFSRLDFIQPLLSVRMETRWGLDLNPRASWGLPRVWTNGCLSLCEPVTDWQSVPLSVISVMSDAERTSRRKWMNAETAQPDSVCDFTAQAKTLYSLYNCIKLHRSNTSVLHTWSACSLFCLIALLI